MLGPLLYISTSVIAPKNLKKAKNLQQISAKNSFFLFAPERWSTVLFPKNQRLECPVPKSWSKYTTGLTLIYFCTLYTPFCFTLCLTKSFQQ